MTTAVDLARELDARNSRLLSEVPTVLSLEVLDRWSARGFDSTTVAFWGLESSSDDKHNIESSSEWHSHIED